MGNCSLVLSDQINSITSKLTKKEPRINELRNQCRIIWTTELAIAQEKLNELESQREEILKFYAQGSIQHRLEEAMKKAYEEYENLHRQFLEGEIDLGPFVQKYIKDHISQASTRVHCY